MLCSGCGVCVCCNVCPSGKEMLLLGPDCIHCPSFPLLLSQLLPWSCLCSCDGSWCSWQHDRPGRESVTKLEAGAVVAHMTFCWQSSYWRGTDCHFGTSCFCQWGPRFSPRVSASFTCLLVTVPLIAHWFVAQLVALDSVIWEESPANSQWGASRCIGSLGIDHRGTRSYREKNRSVFECMWSMICCWQANTSPPTKA